MPKTNKVTTTPILPPDPYVATLLEKISDGKRLMSIPKGDSIFSQGDRADSIYFLESGRVKVSVVSPGGKEAVLSMLGPHDFFGEGALVGQISRMNSVMALEAVTVFQIEKRSMLRALRILPELTEKFMTALLNRNFSLEGDLLDQHFNDSEKRLARVLLKLGHADETDAPSEVMIPTISHETLAEMVGTTRSRVTHFMNKFKRLGLIDYEGELTVKVAALKEKVLRD